MFIFKRAIFLHSHLPFPLLPFSLAAGVFHCPVLILALKAVPAPEATRPAAGACGSSRAAATPRPGAAPAGARSAGETPSRRGRRSPTTCGRRLGGRRGPRLRSRKDSPRPRGAAGLREGAPGAAAALPGSGSAVRWRCPGRASAARGTARPPRHRAPRPEPPGRSRLTARRMGGGRAQEWGRGGLPY